MEKEKKKSLFVFNILHNKEHTHWPVDW